MFTNPNTVPDVERYTPPEIVAATREALGGIDLDPCTTALVNGTFIRASHYYTKENNGLNRERMPWAGRVYINPPSYIERDGTQQRNAPQLFWERLVIEYEQKHVTAGMFLAFNIEYLQQSQNWNRNMLQYPFCIPAKRLTFWREKGGRLESREHPEFASAVIYVGKNSKRFAKAFESIGTVIIPRIANPRTITTSTPPFDVVSLSHPTNGPPENEEHYGIHCAVDPDPSVDTPARINREVSEATGVHLNTDEACRIATAAEEKLTTIDSLRAKGHSITWDCPICKGMPRQTRCAYIKAANVNIEPPETANDLEPTSGD